MSTEIVSYEDRLAAMAKKAAAVVKPSGSSISVRAGIMQYNGQPVPGNKLDCIIIASTFANLYYEGRYDPNNITSPVCFAYGEEEEGMAPHPASTKPQAASCARCPQNAWGSDPDGGRGKACKNSKVLGLLPAGTDDAASAEVAVLKLPVMSVKNFDQYVQKLEALFRRPPLGMETTIGVVPDAKSQFRITFNQIGPVANDHLEALFAREQQVLTLLQHAYEPSPEQPEAKPKGKAKY